MPVEIEPPRMKLFVWLLSEPEPCTLTLSDWITGTPLLSFELAVWAVKVESWKFKEPGLTIAKVESISWFSPLFVELVETPLMEL